MTGELCTVLIVTFDRPKEIRRTLYAFLENVHYNRELLLFHLADDASPGNYIGDIMAEFPYLRWSHTRTERQGWGANVNTALKAIHTNMIFLMEDDYVAMGKVNLMAGVKLLQVNDKIGLVRYDGIAGHNLTTHWREYKDDTGRIDYGIIDRGSPHLNCYSNRPHLRHKRFTEYYGYYPENKPLGWTEEAFAHHVKKAPEEAPHLAILDSGVPRLFDHIGKSRQRSEYDIGKVPQ